MEILAGSICNSDYIRRELNGVQDYFFQYHPPRPMNTSTFVSALKSPRCVATVLRILLDVGDLRNSHSIKEMPTNAPNTRNTPARSATERLLLYALSPDPVPPVSHVEVSKYFVPNCAIDPSSLRPRVAY